MPRAEQTVAYSITPVVPTTAGTLPVFSTTGNPSRATDSIYSQADNSHAIIIGLNAGLNAGQVANSEAVVIGEGSTGWGSSIVIIGDNNTGGQTAAKDGLVIIGNGCAANAKNAIRIGSGLAFGAASGDQGIAIGTQCTASTDAVAIGRGAIGSASGVAIGHTASTNGTSDGIAIGKNATAAATGVNHFSIAIGGAAAAGANNGKSAIAIGHSASALHALGISLIAIGDGAVANVSSGQQSIALGAGATVTAANEIVIGDGANGNHIAIFTVKSAAGAGVRHRAGADGSWSIRDVANALTLFTVDASAVANDVRLLVYDVTAALLQRVTIGAANSGGAGFRLLRIPN